MVRLCSTLVLVAVALAARAAEACNPCNPTGSVELASEAPTQPANSGVLVFGVEDPDAYVEARVDGVLVDLERIDGIGLTPPSPWQESIAARIEPTPPEGAQIELLSSSALSCFGETNEPETFVAGPPDDQAPANLLDPHWDLFDIEVLEMAGCIPWTHAILYIRGELADEDDTQAGRILEVEVTDGKRPILLRRMLVEPGDPHVQVEINDGLGDVAADELCVRVTMADVAGHHSEPSAWMCRPCHAVVVPETLDAVPPEPEWTDETLVPDGHCGVGDPPEPDDTTGPTDPAGDSSGVEGGDAPQDSGDTTGVPPSENDTSTSSAETSTSGAPQTGGALDRGCACTSAPRIGAPSWLLLLLFVRRRVHSRRSASSRTHGASAG